MKKSNHITVFIVEDNKVFTLALKADIENTFKTMCVTVYSFETGEACMEKFKEIKPEIVILDYHLDGQNSDAVNGIKILDWIKKENCETNVIILSGDDNLDIAVKSFKHGASDYVVKTETQFKKINYSLSNIFKLIATKSEANKYKLMFNAILIIIGTMVGGIIVYRIIPGLIN